MRSWVSHEIILWNYPSPDCDEGESADRLGSGVTGTEGPGRMLQFKTLKYRPAFPERFGSIQDARAHCRVFFPWYNTAHHHSGLGLLTPADVHYGLAEQ